MNKKRGDLFSWKSLLVAFTVSLGYLVASYLLIGYKPDQLILVAIFNGCFFLSAVSRKFILGFSIFIVYWILFDYMKAFPNYLFNNVHIQDLYNAERSLFGSHHNGRLVTPNEFWLGNASTALDILTGIFYLCWIPVPLALAAYFFFTDKEAFLNFSLTFVFVNLIGFIIYYAYPAAPPWYYQLNGANFIPGTIGNTAGLHRFDEYFNVRIFHGLYAKSSNVFGAMPSLHSAYPLIVAYYGVRKKLGWINIVFVMVALGIWFAAVYTGHHYILDVLAGIFCAITGIFLYNEVLLRTPAFRRFLAYFRRNL